MRIVTIGNCQAQSLGNYLHHLLHGKPQVNFLSVTERVGPIADEQQVSKLVSKADLVLSTHLEAKHKYLSNSAVHQKLKHGSLVTLPYFYNTGFASLIYSPIGNKVFGGEPIESLKKTGVDKYEAKEMLEQGRIEFNIINRFGECMNELAQREQHCTLKIAPYIYKCYRTTRLFDTHNHPSKGVYYCLLKQIFKLDLMPLGTQLSELYQDMLPPTSTSRKHHSITPQDVEQHGYQFSFDQN